MNSPRTSNDPRYEGDKRERAAALYAKHGSVRAVAEEMEVTVRRAWEYLRDAGVEMNKRGRPRKEVSE